MSVICKAFYYPVSATGNYVQTKANGTKVNYLVRLLLLCRGASPY